MKSVLFVLIFYPIVIFGQNKDTIHYSIGIVDVYYIFNQLPTHDECDFLRVQLMLIYPPYEMGSCGSDVILNTTIDVTNLEYAYLLKEKDALLLPFTSYIGYGDGVPSKYYTDKHLKSKKINKEFEDILLNMEIISCTKNNIPKKKDIKLLPYFSEKNETLALLYGSSGATGWGRSHLLLINTEYKDVEERIISVPFCGSSLN